MRRFLSIALSIVLFAIISILIIYVPIPQKNPDVHNSTFWELFTLGMMLVAIIYLILGLPLSIIIDKVIDKLMNQWFTKLKSSVWKRYFLGLSLYNLAGILVGPIILVTIFDPVIYETEFWVFVMYGTMASNIYYHSSLLMAKIWVKD